MFIILYPEDVGCGGGGREVQNSSYRSRVTYMLGPLLYESTLVISWNVYLLPAVEKSKVVILPQAQANGMFSDENPNKFSVPLLPSECTLAFIANQF